MMNYFQKKKLAFMSIVNRVKGFIRTITGALPLTLEGCVDEESIIDYTLYGQSVQNGTPTPTTPIEVESVGERTANLWGKKTAIAEEGVNLTYEWDEKGGVYFHNISTITKQCDVDLTLPAGTYTFQTSRKVYFYKDGGNSIGYTTFNTISSTEEFVLTLRFFVSANASDYLQAMVVEGEYTENTMPPYEPYGYKIPIKVSDGTRNKNTNIYLDEPLRKVGDYADYIKSVDLVNGTGVVVRNVKKKQLTKASNRYVWVNKKGVNFYDALDSNYTHNKALCNRNGHYTNNGNETITMWLGISNKFIYWIGILDYLGFTTLEEMNEWLTNNPTYLFYGTDLPTETPITLPSLPTFKGTSIISADTTIQPSNAEITYYSNVKE